MSAKVKIFTLSTCSHCTQAKDFLDERKVAYDPVSVDFMSGDERTRVLDTLRKLNPAITFPTIVIGEKVIAGFRREEIEAALKEANLETEVQTPIWQQP
ncbi:MAG: glutaredoxin-like protein [Solidesulfovibrio magneticus str. Maddingley MBC34]|uniref:Glutaredoxin-like protein n=1 Tax=Solidesulfovibrio magneticus str. Maddingley MBC34 TaxID=1206767 RepID=K6GUN2_9BACT|nr:MAG: glutaredoxin-like protein [Solidesulfovibrio magneticus str. Maddingley MBC34]